MEFLRQLLNGVVQAWRRLSPSARVNLALAGLITTVLVVYMVVWGSQPQYVLLYENLNPKETAKIVDTLNTEKVPYKLENDEQSVLVPLQERSRMKIALSSKGLPTTQGYAPGFESLQGQDLMTNRWLQDVRFMQAVQGELQRQLNEFEFVNKSFVFIREAKEELFASQQKPSEAAVTLDVKRPLTKPEIKAILHTVSSFGGSSLSPDNITLVTTDGTPLHLPPTDQTVALASSNLDYISEIERQREQRILEDFKQLGVKSIVKVSAVVDFDSKTETSTKNEDGAVVSSYTTTTTTTTKEAPPQGAPGAMANMPPGAAAPGGQQSQEQTEETTENFEPTVTKTETVHQPGKVKQYLVSAIIEGKSQTATDAQGNQTTQYVGLTPEEKKAYEAHIMAAVGGGDTPAEVTINDLPFSIAKLSEATEAFQQIEGAKLRDTALQYAMNLGKIALIVAGFLFVRKFLRRALVVPVEREEDVALERPTASPEDLRREEIAVEVARMSQEDPNAVAALLRSWIAQDEK